MEVSFLAFIYAILCNIMQKMTKSGKENFLSQDFLGWKVFNNERETGNRDELKDT